MLEGKITGLTHQVNVTVDGDGVEHKKDETKFMLIFYHAGKPKMGKVTYYTSSMSVTFYGLPAIRVLTKFRNNDWILVQGHLRQHESGKYKLVGVHIDFTDPVWININPSDIKESTNGSEEAEG